MTAAAQSTAADTAVTTTAPAKNPHWLSASERGTVFGLRFFFWACHVMGRRGARLCLRPVALYYTFFNGRSARASRQFLSLCLPEVTWRHVYRHMLSYAEVILDRVFFVRGELGHFRAKSNGFDLIRKARAAGRGVMLLGAHVGSIDAMRAFSGVKDVPVNVLMYSENARMLATLLRELNPAFAGRILELKAGDTTALLRAKELIDQGEVVALMGDRVGLNDKCAAAQFFGKPAQFSTAPFHLAALLKCPVFLVFGLYHPPREYECFCEPLVDEVILPRGDRDAAAAKYVQQYASRIEHYARMSPYNWFNFFDFWSMST